MRNDPRQKPGAFLGILRPHRPDLFKGSFGAFGLGDQAVDSSYAKAGPAMRGVGHPRDGSLFLFDNRARKNYEPAFDYLAGRARAAGVATATNEELARDLGISLSTAQRAIRFLLAAGLIERRRVPNGDSQFRVFEVAPAAPFAPRFNGRKRRRKAAYFFGVKRLVKSVPMVGKREPHAHARGVANGLVKRSQELVPKEHPSANSKVTCSNPRTPDKVIYIRERGRRSPGSADALAIAGELNRFGVAQPAAIRAATQNSDPATVALWIAYAERSPQVRSARCYVGAMAARGARLWPSQRRRASTPAEGRPSWPGLNGAPPGRQDRAKEGERPEPRGRGGANLRRLADLAAEVSKRR